MAPVPLSFNEVVSPMGFARYVLCLICCTAAVAGLQADGGAYEAVIVLPEVEVRAGPSMKIYPTGKLRYGDRVAVIGRRDGEWLAIRPPAGSFNWIKRTDIDADGIVTTDDAQVFIGSALTQDTPTKFIRVRKGSHLEFLRAGTEDLHSSKWVRIKPLAQDERYIPVNAVQSDAPPKVADGAPADRSYERHYPSGTTARGAAGQDSAALWTLAEQAEREGRLADAERLYVQLASQTEHHELRIRCYNRVNFLRAGLGTAATTPAAPVGISQPATGDSRLAAGVGANWRNSTDSEHLSSSPWEGMREKATLKPAAPVQPTLPPDVVALPRAGAAPIPAGVLTSGTAPARPGTLTAASVPVALPQWSEPGELRRAAFSINKAPVYALETPGKRVIYVVAAPGANLDQFIGRNVWLYGTRTYHGQLRTDLVTATHVEPVK